MLSIEKIELLLRVTRDTVEGINKEIQDIQSGLSVHKLADLTTINLNLKQIDERFQADSLMSIVNNDTSLVPIKRSAMEATIRTIRDTIKLLSDTSLQLIYNVAPVSHGPAGSTDVMPAPLAGNALADLLSTLPNTMSDVIASDPEDLQLLHAGFEALYSADNSTQLKELLKQKEWLPIVEDAHKQTLLHYAISMGHTDKTTILIDAGASFDAQTAQGLQPVHIAASKGYANCLNLLHRKGAFMQERLVEVTLPCGTLEVNALGMAILFGQTDVIDTLFNVYPRADQLRVSSVCTILHLAVFSNNSSMLTFLLNHPIVASSSDLYNEKNRNLDTPLDLAIKLGYSNCVEILLQHPKVYSTLKKESGRAGIESADGLISEKNCQPSLPVGTQSGDGSHSLRFYGVSPKRGFDIKMPESPHSNKP